MTFDISRLDTRALSDAGVAMPILHPRSGAPMLGSDGLPVTITLLGPNCATFKKVQRELQTRRTDAAARGIKLTDQDLDRERFDMLVAVTTGWTFDTFDGKPFPFTPDNLRAFWSDKRHEWVQFQAWAWCQQDGNYLPSS